jgi:hypothetical protein
VKLTVIPLSVLSLGLFCAAQSSRPVPAGMRHAQELEAQNERGSLPSEGARTTDRAALQHDADQLASLAASVPPGVHNANKGLLEKDLIQKLKLIEKLSKRLRNQLDH